MNRESLNITQDNLDKLKSLFPDIFSEGKIDMEKFKATFSDDINFANERYVLNWAGKSDAFKVLQIPTTATLKPQPDQSINFDNTQNVFIEGENLEVLKVLQKAYYGKIKVIEIDPPYNTGSDSFIYPDSFKENKAEYEKRIGDKDEEGYLMKEGMFRKNSKDSGHYHSNWLSMMYPRLFLAKNLLRDDGVIFVHIDDNEVHNLRLLMNEIFGEENFVAEFIWEKKYTTSNNIAGVSNVHEYILCYIKSITKINEGILRLKYTDEARSRYKNPDNDPRGDWMDVSYHGPKSPAERPNLDYEIIHPKTGKAISPQEKSWAYERIVYLKHREENRLWWGKDLTYTEPRLKKFFSEMEGGLIPRSILTYQKVGGTSTGRDDLRQLFGENQSAVFDNPKPVNLLKKLIGIGAQSDCIVLDFFGGSGTIAQAILELNKEDDGNRKFILVQLPELTDLNSEAYKTGNKTIADISKERIRRVIKKIEKEKSEKPDMFDDGRLDLGFKVFKLSPSNFKIWRSNEITKENLEEKLELFTNPVKEESKTDNMLYELMLKAGYLLTDKVETKGKYFSVNDGELIIALEELNQKIIDSIIAAQPKKVITLDNLFIGNDQLKTNTVLQMKDAGINFKTI